MNSNDALPTTAKDETPRPQTSSAGVVVLQWLTYAFWGWLILGLIWLLSVILINAIVGSSVNEIVPYAIAASIVLLPLAFICDLFYRKYEPIKKAGASMIIMVIHSVLFALLGIAALIVTVFTTLNMAINIDESVDAQLVTALTAGFATILYAATFLRTLSPFKSKKITLIYGLSMLAITVLLLVFAIAGPVIKSFATRDDRRIEVSLPFIQNSIENYITSNNALPASLHNVTIDNDAAAKLVADNKVEYISDGKVIKQSGSSERVSYHYQLCVTYTAATRSPYGGSSGYSSYSEDDDDYASYLATYSHKAGRVCYKLQQVDQSYNYGE